MKTSIKITLAILVLIVWTNTSIRSTTPATPENNSLPEAQDSVPAGWRKIDADGKFSFYLPPDMRDLDRGSLENYHDEYTNGRVHVSFDYKPSFRLSYERRAIAFGKGFEEIEFQIDGKKAFMFVYEAKDWRNKRIYMAQLNVGDLPNGECIIWMIADSRSRQGMDIAKKIFRTVRLPSSSENK